VSSPLRLERERKRLEYELRIAAEQLPYLRAMLEGSSDALLLVDPAGIVVEHNTAALAQLDPTVVNLTGRSVATLFFASAQDMREHGGDRAPLFDGATFADLPADGLRCWGLSASGERLELLVSRAATGLGRPLYVLASRELTDAAQQARALREAQENVQDLTRALQLERQQEKAARLSSLSVLAGALSHDLNNSLAVVLGNLDLLSEAPDAPDRGELLRDIRMGAEAALALASRLTSFAKGPAFVREPVVAQEWLAKLVRAFRSSHRVTVEVVAPEHPVVWTIDERQMTQVVLNLLINAVQASGTEHPLELTITDELESDFGSMLSVRDHGPGLPPHLGERVFEPFVSTKSGGSGLGLASARRIVQGHGGELDALDAPGGGACFRIRLPREHASSALRLATIPPDSIELPQGSELLAGIEVVVMDDEPIVLETLRRTLASRGARVIAARTGEEVLRWVEERGDDALRDAPPLFVLDLLVEGGMDGVATLESLRARLGPVRAIACSGHPPDDMPADLLTLGFDALVSKPFRPSALVETVLRVMRASVRG
jgi:two-component system cell cycle sensor histidine kinase/response regulator CckA